MSNTPQIFISYSHIDTAAANFLATFLRGKGYRVWIDNNLRIGASLTQEILTAIHDSEYLIICMSPDSLESTWCRKEVEEARRRGKDVIPVIIRPLEPFNIAEGYAGPLNIGDAYAKIGLPTDTDYQLKATDLSENFAANLEELLKSLPVVRTSHRKKFGVALLLVLIGLMGVYLFTKVSATPPCNNLLKCSNPNPVCVFTSGSSCSTEFVAEDLVTVFQNKSETSGVALQFSPALSIQSFNSLELRGASSLPFAFIIEYKVKRGTELIVVATSDPQTFSATTEVQTVTIPLAYAGKVDEVVISFTQHGQTATVVIDSIKPIK
jgi:hypothetical protein